jgi:iron complex outermembrane receptor protein
VGLKSTWFDGRLIVNVAAFTYDLEGQQINKTLSGGPAGFSTIFQNAAETTADGVEIEFAAILSDNFRVNGSLNWLDSRYVDFLTKDPLDPRNIATPGPCPAGDPPETCFVAPSGVPDVQLAGNRTRNSPEWSGNLHVEFDLPRMNLPADGTLTLIGDVLYRDDVFFTEFERLIEGQEGYALIDFALRFVSDDDKIMASVWVKNAADEEVKSSTFQLSTGRVLGVTYMPPRTYGLTVGYRF